MMMQDFGTTVLVSTPSYALYLAEQGESEGIDFAALPLRLGLFGGEPCSDRMKAEIEAKLRITATDNYGLSEVMGPGVAGECECACGLHVAEDHFLLEMIDPVTGGAGRPGRGGGARHHDPDEGGVPGPAVPDARPDDGSTRRAASAGERLRACRRSAAAPTTCSSSGA